MLGAFICLLTNYAKFVLKIRIKEVIQIVETIGLKKGNVEVISEFPDILVIKTLSRQARIQEKRSIAMPLGSEIITICFKQIVIKNNHHILCLRGELTAKHESNLSEFITMAGAEIEDEHIDINLCSCSDASDVDKLYLVLRQSFRGFDLDILMDDIRFVNNVNRGEDDSVEIPVAALAYRFKSIDGVSYMYRENKEELLIRKLAHMNIDCEKACCTTEFGDKLSKMELTDRMIEDLELIVHGKEQNRHQIAFFRDDRRRRKEQQYVNSSERNWEDGRRIGRGFGVENRDKEETVFRALKPGPLSSYMINKEEEKLFSEQAITDGGLKKKKKKTGKKVKIGERGKGKEDNKTKSYGVARGYQEEDDTSDPDWVEEREVEVSSEDYTEGEDEDLEALNRDARLPLAEVLKGARLDLKSIFAAEMASGYIQIAKGVDNGDWSEEEAFEKMKELKEKLEREYGIGKKKTRNENFIELDEGSTDPGSLTSGGGANADFREQEVQQMDRLKKVVEDVTRKHNGGDEGGEVSNPASGEVEPGVFSRLTRGWTTDGRKDPRSRSSE